MSYVAPITTINLGVVQIQGVLLEDGSFGVTAQQTNELFQLGITPRNMTRTLNRLVPNQSSPNSAS